MTADGTHAAWPASRLEEALEALARLHRLPTRGGENGERGRGSESSPETDGRTVGVQEAAARLGVEAQRVGVAHADLSRFLRSSAPALVELPGGTGPHFLPICGRRGRDILVVGQDLSVYPFRTETLCSMLRQPLVENLATGVERLLEHASVPAGRRLKVRAALLEGQLRSLPIGGCWLLRASDAEALSARARRDRLLAPVALVAGAHAAQHILLVLSWWVLGTGLLQGRSDAGWLLAWALLLLSMIPFRALEQWSLGWVAARLGVVMRQQLLERILHLQLDVVRRQGAGQLLGRVMEAEALESLVLSGGHVGLVAGVELLIAVPVLLAGAGGALHAALLGSWVIVSLLMSRRYWRLRREWAAARLAITEQLVESMVGYRTRLAQEEPARWHGGEDRALADYAALAKPMDRSAVWLKALLPRGWLIAGLAGLAPALVSGQATVGSVAVAVGGVLLAYRALWKAVRGLSDLVDANIAWSRVAPILHGTDRAASDVSRAPLGGAPLPSGESVLVQARGLAFRYPSRSMPVLQGCDLRIRGGDRIVLEGTSGAGKSTLAALLAALRVPDSGLLLLGGLDRYTLGSTAWRRRVVTAPQFHENHVLTGTFAYNVLMGRRWPPEPEDLAAAEAVCCKLGLGDLLKKMPAGLMQMIGDTGWQLSHGERSRLFMARALLQEPDLLIVDEGLGALDSETQAQCLDVLLEEARALILISHL